MPGAVVVVTHDASERRLMHGDDHRRRGAGLAQCVADVRDIGERRAAAAELARHQQREKTVAFGRLDGLCREGRVAIDGQRMGGGDVGDRLGALPQVQVLIAHAGARYRSHQFAIKQTHDAIHSPRPHENSREVYIFQRYPILRLTPLCS